VPFSVLLWYLGSLGGCYVIALDLQNKPPPRLYVSIYYPPGKILGKSPPGKSDH